jgi:hypothetical protein
MNIRKKKEKEREREMAVVTQNGVGKDRMVP